MKATSFFRIHPLQILSKCFLCAIVSASDITFLAAQETNIVVAIAVEKKYCGSNYYYTDLGLSWWYASTSISELERKAKEDVMDRYPNYSHFNVKYNNRQNKHIVIISTTTPYQNCDRHTYGVGFGSNSYDALEKAKESLYGSNWNWGRNDPYKLVLDKSL